MGQPFFLVVWRRVYKILTGLIAGSYPAIFYHHFQPVKVLKGTFKNRPLFYHSAQSAGSSAIHGFSYFLDSRYDCRLQSNSDEKKPSHWIRSRQVGFNENNIRGICIVILMS